MDLVTKIEQEIAPSLAKMGYDIVRINVGGGDIKVLQVMAERSDSGEMTVDDCEKISHTVSALLDVVDPFAGRWTLEVSSPGIDRPLVKLADYDRFSGHEAKIEVFNDIDGRKRFKGQILGVKDGQILFDFEGKEITFAHDNIAKAKLVLTDELLKKHQH
ncbi:MAG: ribosome maturation factor RimP [Lactobacillales bacterium]|jgi:ribosome maturation factor RimP|nr:ribosome maturation factor RimP [Lactobacillales bacterium]